MKQITKVISFIILLTLGGYAFNYNSVWVNENQNTRGVTKLVIKNNGQIKAFGQCHPNDCDWGNTHYTRTRNGLLASWRQVGIGHKVILVEAVSQNRVKAVVKYLYNGARADKTKIEYFRKRRNNIHGNAKRFTGNWVNDDPNTRNLTRLNIRKPGNTIFVHAWGKCHPRDCDWGRTRASLSNNKLTVRWNQGFVDRVMTIKGEDFRGGRYHLLHIKTTSHYHDSRGTRTEIQYMRRVR
ncbi:MAG: hypothetical protein P794_10065 [Epsilonproteobacteria bacterium (ex Lamellibrachia satsuma)]|nr:MAG: hypothetical protein P794_10065 [Epsilonproteobacteria bacterium (ex Lamellibrachia satsuma)]